MWYFVLFNFYNCVIELILLYNFFFIVVVKYKVIDDFLYFEVFNYVIMVEKRIEVFVGRKYFFEKVIVLFKS